MAFACRTWRFGSVVLSVILGLNAAFGDPNATWEVEPSMLVARDQFTGGVIGQYLYVFGGNGNPDGMNLKSTEAFNFDSGAWSFRADNEHNHGHGVEELTGAVVDDKLYVFGAYGGTAPDGYYGVFSFNEMYDPATDTWTTLTQKPTTSTAGPAVVYNGEIYIFGGSFDSQNPAQEDERYGVVECYSPADDSWRVVTNMPNILSSPAVAVVGSKAYVIGGYSHSLSSMVSDVASFDFQTGQWLTEGYAPLPSACIFPYSSAPPVVNGRIYLVGGGDGSETSFWGLDDVYIFDPASNTWEEGPSLPEPRDDHLVVLHNDRIYVIGGWTDPNDEDGALSSVLSLDVSSASDVNEHVFMIEMSKTYDYRWYSGPTHAFNFDAAVQADDTVSSIVMATPGGSEFVLDVEDDSEWFDHHVRSLTESDLAVYTAGTYTFTVHYAAGGSDTTTVLYAQPGGEAIPPVTQQPVLLSPSDGATGVSPSVTFRFETPTDPNWTVGLEWEAVADSNDAGEADIPSDANSYGPVALSPNTEYEVVMTIDHAVWGTNADGIPTVVDTDAAERFTFTTRAAALPHDWNDDGIRSIVGDVPPFVQCLYFHNCPAWSEERLLDVGDCNHDGILSIIGDVPCFVECVYFNNCPQ